MYTTTNHKRAQRAWKTFVLCLSLGLAMSGSLMAQDTVPDIEDLGGRMSSTQVAPSPLQPSLTTDVPSFQLSKAGQANCREPVRLIVA